MVDLCYCFCHHSYDWLFLRTIVSLGYLGWIFYSSLFVAKTYMVQRALSGDSDSQSSRFNNMVNYKRGAARFLSAYFGHAFYYSAIGQCCIRGRFYYIVCTAYPQEFTVAVLHICLLSPPFLAPCHQGKTHSTWSTPRSLPAHSLVGTDPTCDSLHPCVGNTGKARSHWAL